MARSTASPIIPLSRDSRFSNPANPREGPKVLSVVVGSGRSGTPAPRTPGELLPSYASCRADRNGCGDPFFHSFRTLFSPAAAKGLSARYDLRPRDDRVRAEVDREPLDVLRGTAYQPDTVITTDSNTLAPIHPQWPLDKMRWMAGDVRIGNARGLLSTSSMWSRGPQPPCMPPDMILGERELVDATPPQPFGRISSLRCRSIHA